MAVAYISLQPFNKDGIHKKKVRKLKSSINAIMSWVNMKYQTRWEKNYRGVAGSQVWPVELAV